MAINLNKPDYIKAKILTSSASINNSSQIVTSSKKHMGLIYLPHAFTEHGVTMLASVLRSERAVKMNIAIVRPFIALRQFAMNYKELAEQINEIRQTVTGHNEQLNQIYDAIENLLNEKSRRKNLERKKGSGLRKNKEIG